MQFFKISVIYFFLHRGRFALFFLSRKLFSAVSRPIFTKFSTNMSLCAIYSEASDFWKFKKPGHGGWKTSKNQSNFRHRCHVFARCDETVKVFRKVFLALTSTGVIPFEKISLRQFRTVLFSQSLGSMERRKRETLTAIISQTVRDTSKFVWSFK